MKKIVLTLSLIFLVFLFCKKEKIGGNTLSSKEDERKSLLILSAPRTTSTLLLRFFSQPIDQGFVKNSKILLEPNTQIYHEKIEEGVPGYYPQRNWPKNHKEMMKLLELARNHFVVAKELAYQTEWSDEELKWLSEHYHILFLIRDPKKTIPSNLYPYYKEESLGTFEERSIGYEDLGKLFKRFESVAHITPWVIEAEEYLTKPDIVLKSYYKAFQMKWRESYLTLTPKTAEEKEKDPAFLVWPDWYQNAYASSGIKKERDLKKHNPLYEKLIKEEKEFISNLLEKSLPPYHYIQTHGCYAYETETSLADAEEP